jgi:hypothetical protein
MLRALYGELNFLQSFDVVRLLGSRKTQEVIHEEWLEIDTGNVIGASFVTGSDGRTS